MVDPLSPSPNVPTLILLGFKEEDQRFYGPRQLPQTPNKCWATVRWSDSAPTVEMQCIYDGDRTFGGLCSYHGPRYQEYKREQRKARKQAAVEAKRREEKLTTIDHTEERLERREARAAARAEAAKEKRLKAHAAMNLLNQEVADLWTAHKVAIEEFKSESARKTRQKIDAIWAAYRLEYKD